MTKKFSWLGSPVFRACAALVLVLALGFIFNAQGAFFKIGTHRDALRQISVYGLLACGLTLVIVSGGIDLSVGSVLGLTAVFFSLATIRWGWSPWLAILATLGVGMLVGFASGAMVAWGRMQPFIATLAAMVGARGFAKLISGGEKVSTALQAPDGTVHYVDVPKVFRGIDSQVLGNNVATVTLIFLVCFVVFRGVLDRFEPDGLGSQHLCDRRK
jgi:ribose transport system permease protein